MFVLRRLTAIPKAMTARRVTHSPPPSVKPMAWRVIPSLREKRALLPGLDVGGKDGAMEMEGRMVGAALGGGEEGARDCGGEGAMVALSFMVVVWLDQEIENDINLLNG